MRVSSALAVVAAITSVVSFFFWGAFDRDAPMGVGNLRGTALWILVVTLPLMLGAMAATRRGSVRASLVWLACLGYLAYNAVLFCFASHFSAYFLLYTTLLALSFWSLLTLLRAIDPHVVAASAARVPVRTLATYLFASTVFFAFAWLSEIVPATLGGTVPQTIDELGLTQNPVWVLDFAFTFPLMVVAGVWLLRRRPWGYVTAAMMVIMLTIETAGVAIDQWFGHLHDPTASLAAIPVLLAFTLVGLVCSAVFLLRLDSAPAPERRSIWMTRAR